MSQHQEEAPAGTLHCEQCPRTIPYLDGDEDDALMDLEDHMNHKHSDPAASEVYEDPWATPAEPILWPEPAPYVPMTDAEKKAVQERAKAKFVYLGQPYTVSWCDNEKGWSECACRIIWHYKSACSLPREIWADKCEGDQHAVVFSYVFDDCHCGGGDPYIEHPCIGHDNDGKPFLGPSKFIDYADRRY